MTDNQDYVAALLHGRRSRMAEGPRLQALCRSRTVADLGRELLGKTNAVAVTELEAELVTSLAREIAALSAQVTGPVALLLDWLTARFQVENLKVLLRRLLTAAPEDSLEGQLVSLPLDLMVNVEGMAKAETLGTFVRLMPKGTLRHALARAVDFYHEKPRPFFFEAALDQAYFAELLVRVDALSPEDNELVKPIVLQELDMFHLFLVTRGKLTYGLEPETLRPFHLPGSKLSADSFERMLAQPNVRAVASLAVGRVVDAWPGGPSDPEEQLEGADAGVLERLAWSRFWRLANHAFRRSHMGPATLVAYVELRRVETANLITVCQGTRIGLPAETLCARLIPVTLAETAHV